MTGILHRTAGWPQVRPGSPFGGTARVRPVTRRALSADHRRMTAQTLAPTAFAAARSRAHGPTAALWHAVELHRSECELDGACELTVCGALARVTTDEQW